MAKVFTFRNKVWRDPVSTGWYFIDLDDTLSDKIKILPDKNASKLGLVKATARVGKTSWKTTLFPTKKGNYVMSIVKVVRQKEEISDGDMVEVTLEFR